MRYKEQKNVRKTATFHTLLISIKYTIFIIGSPYTLEIFDAGRANVSGDGLSLVPLNKTAIFNVDTQGSSSKVDVEITGKFRLFDFFGDAGLSLEKKTCAFLHDWEAHVSFWS